MGFQKTQPLWWGLAEQAFQEYSQVPGLERKAPVSAKSNMVKMPGSFLPPGLIGEACQRKGAACNILVAVLLSPVGQLIIKDAVNQFHP